jgi:hypothetical protein
MKILHLPLNHLFPGESSSAEYCTLFLFFLQKWFAKEGLPSTVINNYR